MAVLPGLLLYGSGLTVMVHLAIEHTPGGSHYHHCLSSDETHPRDDSSSSESPNGGDTDGQWCDYLQFVHMIGGEMVVAGPILIELQPVGWFKAYDSAPTCRLHVFSPIARGPPIV